MIIPQRTVSPRRVFRETTAQGWANRVGGLPPHLWLAPSGNPDGEGVAIECSEIQAAALAWVLYEHIECTVAVEVEVHQNRTHFVANPKGRIVLKDFILTEERP